MSEDWWGTLWTLLVTFCIVIIRCTETFWSPCIYTHYIYTYMHSNTTDPASQFMKTDQILLSIPDCNTYVFTNEVYCSFIWHYTPPAVMCICIPEGWYTNHNPKPKLVSREKNNIMKGSIPNDQRDRQYDHQLTE
jgi:hypothetical protein